jgi:hypothetical protein
LKIDDQMDDPIDLSEHRHHKKRKHKEHNIKNHNPIPNLNPNKFNSESNSESNIDAKNKKRKHKDHKHNKDCKDEDKKEKKTKKDKKMDRGCLPVIEKEEHKIDHSKDCNNTADNTLNNGSYIETDSKLVREISNTINGKINIEISTRGSVETDRFKNSSKINSDISNKLNGKNDNDVISEIENTSNSMLNSGINRDLSGQKEDLNQKRKREDVHHKEKGKDHTEKDHKDKGQKRKSSRRDGGSEDRLSHNKIDSCSSTLSNDVYDDSIMYAAAAVPATESPTQDLLSTTDTSIALEPPSSSYSSSYSSSSSSSSSFSLDLSVQIYGDLCQTTTGKTAGSTDVSTVKQTGRIGPTGRQIFVFDNASVSEIFLS